MSSIGIVDEAMFAALVGIVRPMGGEKKEGKFASEGVSGGAMMSKVAVCWSSMGGERVCVVAWGTPKAVSH